MCRTGRYREHGIMRLDGFLTARALVQGDRVVPAPAELGYTAVLADALTTPVKAVDALRRAQRRIEHPCPHPEHGWDQPGWGGCKTGLVAGLGPVGLLMALKLRLNGVQTWVLGRRGEDDPRVRWARAIGAEYVDLHQTDWPAIRSRLPNLDMVYEMTGSGEVAMRLVDLVGWGGCLAVGGVVTGQGQWTFDHHTFMRTLVLRNQALVGVVNAKRRHLQEAMDDLVQARARYGDLLDQLITHRYPFERAVEAITAPPADAIKIVIELP